MRNNEDFEMFMKARDLHQKEREVLFSNESFAIGVLQAVSGGALFAGISQSATLIVLAGRIAFLIFTSLMGTALLAAVLSAYLKHEYKKWDIKAVAVRDTHLSEASRRDNLSKRFLGLMRSAMLGALLTFGIGLIVLLAASWVHVMTMDVTDRVSSEINKLAAICSSIHQPLNVSWIS
jgi:hypothetical protein